MLKFVSHGFTVLTTVSYRRIFVGKFQPSWSFGLELLCEFIRPPKKFIALFDDPVRFQRHVKFLRTQSNRFVQRALSRTHCKEVLANGVPGEWIIHPQAEHSEKVIYWLHGGAYFLLSVNSHRRFLSILSSICKVKIFAINYRLAPETKFPGALEDSVSAFEWLISSEGGAINPSNITIGGDSAGGGLAVATLLKLRDDKKPLPASCVLLSPWVDLTASRDSINRNASYDYINLHPSFPKLYVHNEEDLKNPLVSPIFGKFHGFPKILIQLGALETLLDEGIDLANRLKEDGVQVELEVWPEMVHCFQLFGTLIKEAELAIQHIGEWIATSNQTVVLE